MADVQGSQPWLDYARSYNNYNYRRLNQSEGVTYENLRCIRTFTDLEDEQGFILTHCSIDGYSPKVVECVEGMISAAKS